jgi:hypothetical protein
VTTRPRGRRIRPWLAALLRDFLLIVVGVLTALMLENWNAARVERRIERESLEALATDLRAHIVRYDDWIATLARHREWTSTIWGWASGTPPDQPTAQVLLWMRLGGQINLNTRLQDGAWQDLVNSGRLRVIRDRALREALVTYNHDVARWSTIMEASGTKAAEEYSAAIAGVIPPEGRWLAVNGSDLSAVDLNPALAVFRSRVPVRSALVAMSESHEFRAGVAENRKNRAIELLARVESELRR